MKNTIVICDDNLATRLSNSKRRNKSVNVKADNEYAKISCRMCPGILSDCSRCIKL